MTAAHCIIKKGTTEFYETGNMVITSYANNTTTTIKVLQIDNRSKIEDNVDCALLIIEKPNLKFDYFNKVKCCDEIIEDESFFFYGYGGPDENNHGRMFNVVRKGQSQWHLVDENIANQSLPAMKLMEGNSGAGVFFQRMGIYYCIGFVKRLLDEEGSFNDIIVLPISLFDEMLPVETKESNFLIVQYIQNLERKMAILYPHGEESKEKVEKQLECYLTGLRLANGLRNSPHIYNRLKEYEAEAYNDYSNDRSSYFSDSSQALADFRNVKEKIRTAVSQALECSSNIKQMVNSYANYDVAERLLICSLDYK